MKTKKVLYIISVWKFYLRGDINIRLCKNILLEIKFKIQIHIKCKTPKQTLLTGAYFSKSYVSGLHDAAASCKPDT